MIVTIIYEYFNDFIQYFFTYLVKIMVDKSMWKHSRLANVSAANDKR